MYYSIIRLLPSMVVSLGSDVCMLSGRSNVALFSNFPGLYQLL